MRRLERKCQKKEKSSGAPDARKKGRRPGGLLRLEKGSTIVEVMAAFFIVMIGLGGFTAAISVSGKLWMKSQDLISAQHALDAAYYQDKAEGEEGSASAKEVELALTESGGSEVLQFSCTLRRFSGDDGVRVRMEPAE